MIFVTNPQLILSLEEFETLDGALKLCRDMDEETSYVSEEEEELSGCNICPLWSTCNKRAQTCVFTVAHKALKEIIDVAIVK